MQFAGNNQEDDKSIKRIGIIGGGAAGLATARAFLHANDAKHAHVQFEVTVLEARPSIGGVWKYDSPSTNQQPKSRPMYRNLRTNLPKEIMAYREFPWGGNDDMTSCYVTHADVHRYLENYANKFNLLTCIHFGCTVTHLKVVNKENHNASNEEKKSDDCESWPQISLEWIDNDNTTNRSYQQTFDAVCICNGHYAIPSSPALPGLTNFRGKVLHAIEYDDPNDFVGKTVLCVGARASGADISREIGGVAHRVYLSDSTCEEMQSFGNVVQMPRTKSIDENGTIHFANGKDDKLWSVDDVDTIIFCSGYDYSFPFINDESNLELMATPGERRVRPLYEQLWHAHHPSLTFLGIPHSVVPFPLFELQAAAIVSQWTSKFGDRSSTVHLPPLLERIAAADRDANSGGPKSKGRVVDTHYLGSHQWDYCRKLAIIAGIYDDAMENYIATNQAIYDRSSMERKSMQPGERDSYRETRFRRLDGEQSYELLYSEMQKETAAGI